MLRLMVNEEVREIDEYVEQFKKEPPTVIELLEGGQTLLGLEPQVVEKITLCIREVSIDHHLQLVASTNDSEIPVFQIQYQICQEIVESKPLMTANSAPLVIHEWLKEVQFFVYAGLSSFLTEQDVTPTEVATKIEEILKETPDPAQEPTIKELLSLQMGRETFPLSQVITAKETFQKLKLREFFGLCYYQFLKEFFKEQRQNLMLGDSDQRFIVSVPESTFLIRVENQEATLPVAFGLALQGDHATEWNDGVTFSQWLWRLEYEGKTVYLPLGNRFELGFFTRENFQDALSDVLEGLNALMGWLELLAIEMKTGMKLSSDVISNQYQTFLSTYRTRWIIDGGTVGLIKEPSQEPVRLQPQGFTGQPLPQELSAYPPHSTNNVNPAL